MGLDKIYIISKRCRLEDRVVVGAAHIIGRYWSPPSTWTPLKLGGPAPKQKSDASEDRFAGVIYTLTKRLSDRD